MISQAAEYSLRAMVLLSRNGSKPLTVQTMATEGVIPPRYLAKLLQGLARVGLVTAQRGLKGGYQLARPADQISLADIVNSVDPLKRISKCPLGIPGHENLCSLHSKLDEIMAGIESSLTNTTLSDLSRSECSPALCSLDRTIVTLSAPAIEPVGSDVGDQTAARLAGEPGSLH